MMFIGLVLIVVAVIFGADMVLENNFHIPDPSIFGQSLGITSGPAFFIIGAIVGAAIMLGIALLLGGMRRKGAKAMSHRKEHKVAKRNEDDRDSLRSDNENLRSQLDEEHRGDGAPQPGATKTKKK